MIHNIHLGGPFAHIKIKDTRFLCRCILAILLPIATILWTGCGESKHTHDHDEYSLEKHSEHEDHEHDSHDEHTDSEHADENSHSEEIIFPASKAKAAGVEVTTVKLEEFNEVIPASGRILEAAGSESTAVATQAGIVRLLKPWNTGMQVNAGVPLFSISNSQLPEGDVAGKAKIEYQRAKSAFEKVEKLYQERLTTEQEYREAKASFEASKLAYESTGSGRTGGTTVTAPKGGYVLECLVKDGDFVEVGTPLMTLTQNRKLQLQANLPQRYAGSIDYITSANFKTGNSDNVYCLRELNGRVVSHGSRAAAGTSFIPVIFEFDNTGGLIAGSFAEIYLITVPRPSIISVPKSALTEDQGVYAVYVQLDEDGYERRVVTIGKTDGRRIEILNGLKEGEKVVTKGAIHVKLASASKAIPGHTHNH